MNVYDVDQRTQAVVFALAEDKDGVMSPSLRMALLGRDMTPLAEIAVKAINEYDAEQVITTTIDTDAYTYFGKTPPP